jgi:hypothetical protein
MYRILSNSSIELGGKTIVFPCSISGFVHNQPRIAEMAGLTIVNFYPNYEAEVGKVTDMELETNIWAFDSEGNLVWKVSPPTVRPYACNPYTSVFEKDGKVYGGNWCGYDFEINLSDGSVTLPPNPGRPW